MTEDIETQDEGCEAWEVKSMEVQHGDTCLHAVNPNDPEEKYPLHVLPSVPRWTGGYGYFKADSDSVEGASHCRMCAQEWNDHMYSVLVPPGELGDIRLPDYVEMRKER